MYEINGFKLFLCENGINHFSKKEGAGYLYIQCTDEQMTNGDIQFMTEHGLTLSSERIRKEVRRYLK